MRRFLLPILLLSALIVCAPLAHALPQVVGETPIDNVPGEILAWQDTVYISLTRRDPGQKIHRVRRSSGKEEFWQVGKRGQGALIGMDPSASIFLARETDSLGVHHIQKATLPHLQWMPLIPVTDPDPHISWLASGRGFLYQDILDDSIGTPCIFEMSLDTKKPHLYLFGGQRPLLAPGGDALAVVAADTLHPGTTWDIEERQPVGVEDMTAGEFKIVAPLRSHVPCRGAWSPDGSRLALVSYGSGASGRLERRIHIYARRSADTKQLIFPGDIDPPDPQHSADVAAWSPDGRWVTVGRPNGSVWIVNAVASQVFELKSTTSRWRGSPLWVDPGHFIIADAGTTPAGTPDPPGRYWLVEVGGM